MFVSQHGMAREGEVNQQSDGKLCEKLFSLNEILRGDTSAGMAEDLAWDKCFSFSCLMRRICGGKQGVLLN